jgi:cleavage stimulation factor subunit 3
LETAEEFVKNGVLVNYKSLAISFFATEFYECKKDHETAKSTLENVIKFYEEDYNALNQKMGLIQDSMKSQERSTKYGVDVENKNQEDSTDDDDDDVKTVLATDPEYLKMKNELSSLKAKQDIISKKLNAIWIQYMKYARRTDGIQGAREVFAKARKNSYCSYQIFVASALFEYQCNKKKEVAFKIFEVGMKTFGENPSYLLEYIKHLIAVADDSNIRSLCEKAFSILSPEKSLEIWKLLLEYENDFGDLASILSIQNRFSDGQFLV